MAIVKCVDCNKEIDLDKKSWDSIATMRILRPICYQCEDKLWDMAESNAEQAESRAMADLERLKAKLGMVQGDEKAEVELQIEAIEMAFC